MGKRGECNTLAAGYVDGFVGKRERFSEGRCVGCGRMTYTAKGYEDPRGPLGLQVYAPLIASEYGHIGPDVVACWGCTQNDASLYLKALARTKKFWRPCLSTDQQWTIEDIKTVIDRSKNDSHFFTSDTLRFFKQRLGDFKVTHVAGRVFVHAPAPCGTLTIREFLPNEKRLAFLPHVLGETAETVIAREMAA